ncbi:MAG: hypothetical protein V7K98_16795 [Nostoc sp.]|uniref:hypothetical protein n=1 Tax=Nostoc sp. TaxID=1180 RepID=UPI002FF97A0B
MSQILSPLLTNLRNLPKFLGKEDVIGMHDQLLSETGESLNIVNEGLLDSALSLPQATFWGEYLH